MTGLDYFAWVVFITIIIAAVAVIVSLCKIPGNIAAENNHPQAAAINIAGWLGLLLSFGVIWVLAIIWAKTTPIINVDSSNEIDELKATIKSLQEQLDSTRETKGDDAC